MICPTICGAGIIGRPGPAGAAGPQGEPGLGGAYLYGFGAGAVISGTSYLFVWNSDANSLIQPNQIEVIEAGVIDQLRVRHNLPNGNDDIVYTLRVNGVATLLSVSMNSADISDSDLVDSVVVVPGDLLDLEAVKPAAGAILIRPLALLRWRPL